MVFLRRVHLLKGEKLDVGKGKGKKESGESSDGSGSRPAEALKKNRIGRLKNGVRGENRADSSNRNQQKKGSLSRGEP